MLNILQNPFAKTESFASDTKCGEIHYFMANFHIICQRCKDIFYEYQHFEKHFQDQHLYELIKDLTIKRNHEKKSINIAEIIEDCGEEIMPHLREENSDLPAAENIETTILNHSDLSEDNASDIDWSHSYSIDNLKPPEKRTYKPRSKLNCCNYCGKIFRRRYQLDTHINIHTGLKPHQCEICGRQFRAITTLQRHLNTHETRKVFTCQFCYKEFTHRAALVSHETRHTQERNIPCDDCEKLFYTLNQLDTHKRKLHNKLDDFSLPFACDICPKRYRCASALSTHKLKKHYKTAKYLCEQCDKKFVDQRQLDKHLTIHFKKS
ncbi:hypothetical protein DOY81_001896 [Sarcophaga bullata]|nr:hypothetical protein DOY81_001896 [Sarcophaga bullata]